MSKCDFSVLHTRSITINDTKYKILHTKKSPCGHCDCERNHDDCINNVSKEYTCAHVIGQTGYLKRIKDE